MNVFLVTDGDGQELAIFSSRERAQMFVDLLDKHSDGVGPIREMEVDNPPKVAWVAEIDSGGGVHTHSFTMTPEMRQDLGQVIVYPRGSRIAVFANGWTEEEAIQIAKKKFEAKTLK